MINRPICVLLASGYLFASAFAHAATTAASDPYIDGITNFLSTRTQANAEYLYQQELKRTERLKLYLPSTYAKLQVIDLLTLLKTNASVWRSDLNKDLEYLAVVQVLQSEQLKGEMKAVGSVLGQNRDKYTRFIASLKRLREKWSGEHALAEDDPKAFLIAAANLDSLMANIEMPASNVAAMVAPDAKVTSVINRISEMEKWAKAVEDIGHVRRHELEGAESYSAVAADLIQKLDIHDTGDGKIQSYMLFFASLADATNADQVTTVLENFMLPPVSFNATREGNHLALSSYVGGFVSLKTQASPNPDSTLDATSDRVGKSRAGIFAPIGLQYSWRTADKFVWYKPNSWLGSKCFDSLYLMVAPVDFGYPLSLKISGSSEGVSWADVVAPSLVISAGMKEMPGNFGIAVQRVNSTYNNPQQGLRTFVFISFDMPLLLMH